MPFVNITTEIKTTLESLLHLPAFAQYILQHRLNDFAALQLQLSEEAEIPLLKLMLKVPNEEKLELLKNSSVELLSNLSQNQAREQIELSVKRWKDNMLPFVQKEDVVAKDITLSVYVRKRCFLKFLPEYSTEPGQIIAIAGELDLFLFHVETAYTDTYFNLLKEKISSTVSKEKRMTAQLLENEYLYNKAEAITHLGSYKWDIKTNELLWSDELYRIYGLTPKEDKIDFEYISSFNNPADTPDIRKEYMAAIKAKRSFDFYYGITSKDKKEKILHARGENRPGFSRLPSLPG